MSISGIVCRFMQHCMSISAASHVEVCGIASPRILDDDICDAGLYLRYRIWMYAASPVDV